MQTTPNIGRSLLVAILFVAGFAASGCLPASTDGDSEPRTVDPADAGGDAGFGDVDGKSVTLPDGGVKCLDGYQLCGDECVDVESNRDHCGECGNSCSGGGIACFGGACQCVDDAYTNCDGACIDTSSSREHCGACGNECAQNEKCADGTCKTKTVIEETVEETNDVRSEGYDCDSEGQYPATHEVEGNEKLHEAAQMHADDMAENQFFSHTYRPPDCDPGASEDCHDFAWRIRQTDYEGQPVSENIARGQSSPQSVVQGWADSDGHCANMLSSRPNEIGIGYAEGPGGPYWVQVFGKK